MLDLCRQHLNDRFPFLKSTKLLVACSGGMDSVVMTHLLHDLGYDLVLAHCNFGLRGAESDGDEAFVRTLGDDLNTPVVVTRFDTTACADREKISIQMAARDLRYEWFAEQLKEQSCEYVLTAHHADDDLETFLINLGRGTGLQGLTGIPEVNGNIVRPLLIFSREDLKTYALDQGYAWREDSSNEDDAYLRNKLRHHVTEKLKDSQSAFLKNFQQTQTYLRDSRALLNDYIDEVRKSVVQTENEQSVIDLTALRAYPNHKALLFELLAQYGFTAWEDIETLMNAQSGKQVFSPEFRLLKDRDVFILTPKPGEDGAKTVYISEATEQITTPMELSIVPVSNWQNTSRDTIFVDRDKLVFPLELRPWQEGDVFIPMGMEGKKKLSKFLKDEKLSLVAKEGIWVLCSNEDIVWVVGMRMSDQYKVTPETRRILQISKSASSVV